MSKGDNQRPCFVSEEELTQRWKEAFTPVEVNGDGFDILRLGPDRVSPSRGGDGASPPCVDRDSVDRPMADASTNR